MAAAPAPAATAATTPAGTRQCGQLDGEDDRHRRHDREQDARRLSHGDGYNRPALASLRTDGAWGLS